MLGKKVFFVQNVFAEGPNLKVRTFSTWFI